MDWRDRQVTVLGLGASGFSAARWLAARGAHVTVADTRDTPPNADRLATELPDVRLRTGPLEADCLENADTVICSPGLSPDLPLLKAYRSRGGEVIGDVELFARALAHSPAQAPVVAITGSNGKSTVTALTGHLCDHAGLHAVVAGNIGLPVLDALQQAEEGCARNGKAPDVYVLELSSFQLETTFSLMPVAATVLNLSEDHMDRYPGMEAYAGAKARIFAGVGVQVLNRQDAYTMRMALPGRTVVTFGLDAPRGETEWGIVRDSDRYILARGSQQLCDTRDLKIAGLHNAANAMAAMALCDVLQIPHPKLVDGLKTFTGLPHRVEWVERIGEINFYDDSKGTNVGATEAALKGMTCKVVLIAGGDGKGQDFSPLAPAVAEKARAVILIGRDADQIGAALADTGVKTFRAKDMEEAVRAAHAEAQAGDAVLLSPACASFDMFRNYEHRAQVFVAAVKELKGRCLA